ncbi:MAG: alginate export family protein [Candidatus Omnitrophota bacterium]|jgi:hypothetical protein
MSRFLKLMSVLAIVALIAVPAFAEVQNVKVSGDIDSKAIYRNNYDLKQGPVTANTDNDKDTWFNTITRIQIDADLTDNVSTCVRLLNERDWNTEPAPGAGTSGETSIALDLANVKMKEMFYAPLTLTIGRQLLRFGSGLVVGDPDTNDASTNSAIAAVDLSARKSFDAIRATLDYNPLTVDIIMAKIDADTSSTSANVGTGGLRNDQDLYGINAAYKFDQYNSEAEAYVFLKNTRQGGANLETDKVYTYGLRGSLEPISKLVVDAEIAMQNGDYKTSTVSKDRSAWAGDVGAAYAIDYKWSPKVAARYSYRSGTKTGAAGNDDDTGDSKYKAWDTMFEDQTHGIIANQIFNGNNDGVDSNGHTLNVMAAAVPMQDLTLAVDYYYYKLAEEWESLVTTTRSLNSISQSVRKDDDLGQELDLSLAYDYTEDVKLGLTAGWFLPGKAFLKDNNEMASTIMADVKVSF